MQCPKCKLENPPNSVWCDCGYDFSTGEVDERHKRQQTKREAPTGYFSFEKLITPTLIKVTYVIGLVAILAAASYGLFIATKQASPNANAGILWALLLLTVGNILWRIICEQAILLFNIHDRLASIDRSLKTEVAETKAVERLLQVR
jgi:uncharacterized protein DUF4282